MQTYVKNLVKISVCILAKTDIMKYQIDAIAKLGDTDKEKLEETRVRLFQSAGCVKFFQKNVLHDGSALEYEFSKFMETQRPMPPILNSALDYLAVAIEDINKHKASLGMDLEIIKYESNPIKIIEMNTYVSELVRGENIDPEVKQMCRLLLSQANKHLNSAKQVDFIKAFLLNEVATSIIN